MTVKSLSMSQTEDILWPGITAMFEQTFRDSKNITLKCVLCLPKINLIKTAITSASNLRTHIKVSSLILLA